MLGDKFNLGGLMKNAKKMQEMIEKAQSELAKIEITGESGGGAVKVTITAKHYVKNIHIDDEMLKEPKEILTDLIAAAFNNAVQKAEEITKSKMMDFSNMFGAVGGEREE